MMKTIVVAVTILNACFMQEVSGDAVLSSAQVDGAALKPEVKTAMSEETKVLDGVQDSLEDAVDEDDTDDEAEDSEDQADADDTSDMGADDEDENGDAGDLDDDEDGTDEGDYDDEDGEVDAIDDMYEENPVVTLTAAMSESVQQLSMKSEDLLVEAQKYGSTETAKSAAEQAMKEFHDAYDKELKEKGTKWEAEVLAKAKQASLLQTNAKDDEDDEEEEMADDDDDDYEEEEVDAIDDSDEENAVVTLVAAMSENVQKLSMKSEDLVVEAQKYGSTEATQSAAEQALKEFHDAFDKELKEKGTKWEDEVFAKAEQAANPIEASPPATDAATDHAKKTA